MTSIASNNKIIDRISNIPSNYYCHKKLFKIVWGDYTCPHCGKLGLKFRDKYEWCPHCRKKLSVKGETFFRHSKLSYKILWSLVWCWQHKWSVTEAHKTLGISELTIRNWYMKFRHQLPEDHTMLYGEVEVDESFFAKKESGKQTLVIGAIERHTRNIRLRIILDRTRSTCERFITDTVLEGSSITTDSLKSYNELHLLGYDYTDCNHNRGRFGQTNQIEGLWSIIKRHLKRTHKSTAFSLDGLTNILKEWENRQNNPKLFYNVDNYLFYCSALLH